jgi:hypothetical protein
MDEAHYKYSMGMQREKRKEFIRIPQSRRYNKLVQREDEIT